ncbi:response regulator receiver domain-containing protein [Roseimicrobium gellanilyticum]|uniref:Response regulator receiver domain-containing protein n=1 Tax=Roseimicrobium gellanilyticum TaxID=748857 RepID=A0A366HMM0_9BACT|nr:response regulator [Roseimicrobium gellanilyticum]RBP44398.1 response regulator receiver domain-containing protein [Roseimicrobium gellanilyticum]
MHNFYDMKRYSVLYVDDEEMALKYFEKTFGREFNIITANNAADGLKIIEERGDELGVLITDQRMPGEKGVHLLERARQLRPRLVRMLITAYADFGVTVDAVNLGSIFRYISKPLQVDDMRNTLHRAMEYYILQQERDELLREKLSVLQNVLITDRVISLGVLASGVGKNLNNPLHAVQSFLELTPGRLRPVETDQTRLRDPQFWRDFHDQISNRVNQVGSLLGEVQSDGGASTSFNPGSIVEEAAAAKKAAASAKGVELATQIDASSPAVTGDAGAFRKLVDLLIDSALTADASGSQASISVKPVAAQDGTKAVAIQYADNSPGLSIDALRSVFDPFFDRPEGLHPSAVNLLGAHLLAHHLGGNITSGPTNGGLNLVVTLPVSSEGVKPFTTRDFVSKVLMNDSLWERLLPIH